MTDSSSSKGGGLLGKLLLPGYTDAGASTTFQAPAAALRGEQQQQKQQQKQQQPPLAASDAATEIRDNRSAVKQQFRMNSSHKYHHSGSSSTTSSVHSSASSAASSTFPQRQRYTYKLSGEHDPAVPPSPVGGDETRYAGGGFFPNTKPQLSPRAPPASPPSVTRQPLPVMSSSSSSSFKSSVAGTSVVPETGGTTASLERRLRYATTTTNTTSTTSTTAASLEKENQRRVLYYWENERSAGMNNNNHNHRNTLNAANLKRAAAAHQTNPSSTYDDSSSSTTRSGSAPNRNTSLFATDEEEDVGSEAMSTASEMGTVIETNHHAARMAEIDAMASLIEASPNVDTLTPRPENSPPAPSRTPNRRTGPDNISNLALPELGKRDENHFGDDNDDALLSSRHHNFRPAVMLAPQTKATSSNVTDMTTATTAAVEPSKNKTSPVHRNLANNPTPSEMLTSALRRIGTGLHKKKTKVSLSAPTTPRTPGAPPPPRVEDLLKSSLTSPRAMDAGAGAGATAKKSSYLELEDQGRLPASLALRSPGSSARFSLSRGRAPESSILAPRFSPATEASRVWLQQRHATSPSFDSSVPSSKTSEMFGTLPSSIPTVSSGNNRRELSEPSKSKSPFRLAQQCFSHDSTTGEEDEEDFLPDRAGGETGSATSSHVLNLEASFPKTHHLHHHHHYSRRTEYYHPMNPQKSASWDVGAASYSGAFRAQPHRSLWIGGLRQTESQVEHNAQRVLLRVYSSDVSPQKGPDGRTIPTVAETSTEDILELKTPQRLAVDVEREDALDILACLVERGVAAWNDESETGKYMASTDTSTSFAREALIASMLQDVRSSLKDNEDDDSDEKAEKVAALDELLKSHSYALEMKRAALSASSWLKSIGRGPQVSQGQNVIPPVTDFKVISEVGQASGEDAASDHQSDASNSATTAVDTKMELLTLKARLHSAENELKEKMIMNQKLDEELSKCRAEIGRLHTASRNENRSILDDDPEESATASTGPSVQAASPRKHDTVPSTPVAKDAEEEDDDDNKLFDESFQGNNSLFQDTSLMEDRNQSQASGNMEILVLKTALEQANETIRLLHEKLHKGKTEEERDEAPTVDIPETSLSSDEHRTINVRMLDGENFVTEWDDLTSPLPPPPDHGLRSPIVHAVLQQWTDDHVLHDSLLSWMERVMTGDNLEDTVPPLTISSLDHQVRDGFTMHVLPLLLRRADIHVSVQMRAHRRTSYDLAISAQQKRSAMDGNAVDSRAPSLLDQHAHDEWDGKYDQIASADSGSHSAITAPIGNVAPRSLYPSQDGDAEYSHFDIPHAGSGDVEDVPQPTFMGALGGAIGGLLSRGKYTAVQSPSRFHTNASPPGFPPPGIRATLEAANSNAAANGPSGNRMAELDNQPYHRVVSAPPGRIGITFVEYRGHAMVADMAPDSPLSSWVFPSDILIAVDEVPVSGMRVRDIIKVLTNRKDRQRALRVISSHAMNEFTLNQSAHQEEEP